VEKSGDEIGGAKERGYFESTGADAESIESNGLRTEGFSYRKGEHTFRSTFTSLPAEKACKGKELSWLSMKEKKLKKKNEGKERG